jgi:DNA-binding MarR family transcriptional regulator
MTRVPRGSRQAKLASQAWTLMFDILMASTDRRARSLTNRALTPNEARALWSLSAEERCPLGSLAEAWECDPSNVTFIVGRLERAGLVDRRESATDRRVKLVGLTAKGARIKDELMAEYRIPPPELLRLKESDLRALIEVFQKIRPESRLDSSPH